MPRQTTIKFIRTTKANLDAQKALNGLIVGEPYLITDTKNFAIAYQTDSYSTCINYDDLLIALNSKEDALTVSETPSPNKFLNELKQFIEITSGSLTIQNNGVSLTERPKLNFVGKQLIADNSSNTSTDIQMFPNMPADSYINQNVYPALEWIWRHTDGYWYFVTMVLDTRARLS